MHKITFKILGLIMASLAFCQEASTRDFTGTIESLSRYETPSWFSDAKFGIYLHWGIYSVPAQGEWYARWMYQQGSAAYKHHVATYGHPSEFGYKDFIPMWKAENFDPDALVGLFKKAGAKYFTPCAVHHDNFDLWDSKHHRWNAVNMGPKKDLIGMWREATLKHGLRFGVTTHAARAYSWMNVANYADQEGPLAGIPYDGDNPEYDDFYFKKHPDTFSSGPLDPPDEWKELWKKRMKDLIDNYHPDHFYFDGAIPFRGNDMGRAGMDVIAHLYNHSMQIHDGNQQAVMCVKERPYTGLFVNGLTTLDYERGKSPDIRPQPWQTDDTIGPWGYREGAQYKETNALVDKLVDIVSKNGNLLLNVTIKADGTLDDACIRILEEMGDWFAVNGAAIYGTRPWYRFGEGKVNETPDMGRTSLYTGKDIRYTTKDGNLYAIFLGWPEDRERIRLRYITPSNADAGTVNSVSLLGHGKVEWYQDTTGLYVTLPESAPSDFAHALEITFQKIDINIYEELSKTRS